MKLPQTAFLLRFTQTYDGLDCTRVSLRLSMQYNGPMQTVYEAAGGRDGLLKLASAWHTRVLEDEGSG
jgi:hypothetical protein